MNFIKGEYCHLVNLWDKVIGRISWFYCFRDDCRKIVI